MVTTEKPPADPAPFENPAIDTQSALKRIGGNRQKYRSLLRRFAESQVGAAPEVRAALMAKDYATAQRTAHSLKGAAANLGANALAAAAGSAELAIKTQSGIDSALLEMERTLLATVAAIQEMLPSAENVAPTLSGNADPSLVLQPLSRLKKLLEADDSEAAEFILDVQGSFSAALSKAEIDTLTRMIGDFDYESALRAVSGIADRLSLKLE